MERSAQATGIQIAIDGPAGAGKSTVGLGLSRALGCSYVDTGLMYRAVALAALRTGTHPSDAESLSSLARSIVFGLSQDSPPMLVIEGRQPSPELRSTEVERIVSAVSEHSAVRTVLVCEQRRLAKHGCIVMVGRDIGTTVLPEANVKLWVTASAAQRARRRQAESRIDSSCETEERITQRDRHDSERAVSPMRRGENVIVIDTGNCSPQESIQLSLDVVRQILDRDR